MGTGHFGMFITPINDSTVQRTVPHNTIDLMAIPLKNF